ncbi:tetratricopeptide repeat-containing sensor histidine kinase [Lutibacter sp.]|uniref:tetratricopeptide repeat-containing sensor histidine kinase n=1 Tax=Lutibacter sp. TaxID=1925666 RepID=UPI002733D30E|nr:tetratricopeptide repeat-containing sensor histidine kinase [Lutibacter sp.]MDP3312423.1 tetratricopeptide repeat-containing sensor histidine kinase [Lutibacter sp.]
MRKIFIIIFLIGCFLSSYSQEQFDLPQLKQNLLQKTDTALITANINIGRYYIKNKNDSSFYYYSNAHKLALKLNSKSHLAETYLRLGDYYEAHNKYPKAIENYIASSLLFDNNSNKKRYAQVNYHLGINYLRMYAENKAIEHFLIALTGYKEINDLRGIAIINTNIGHTLYGQENYVTSEKYYLESLSIYKRLNDSLGISNTYTNLGNTYSEEGNLEKGLQYYNLSLAIQKKLKDEIGVAINYNNIGDSYGILKDYKKANSYFSQSLKEAEKLNEKDLIAVVLLNYSDIYFNQKNYNEAIKYAHQSYKISKIIGEYEYQVLNLELLGKSYDKLGDISNALIYTKKYIKLKDSLYSSDKSKKNQLINTLIELEKINYTVNSLEKEQDATQLKLDSRKKYMYFLIGAIILFAFLLILLLNQQTKKVNAYNLLTYQNHKINKMNGEIEAQKEKLTQLNATKDKFFSIIAHDLKNPFNSIKGFTELLIDNSHEYDDEKRLKFLNIIKASTIKSTNLLNNLLVWAHSQSGEIAFVPTKLNLFNQVADVISLLEIQAATKEIKIINKINYPTEVKADENMLDTILRNLISNALKFTEAKGEIKIYNEIIKDFVSITIEDNGIGISKIDVENIFNLEVKNSRLGTDNESGSGLGLILCKDFVQKHGGEITVSSQPSIGSKFTFTIPMASETISNSVF